MPQAIPRLVIAAPQSGSGKTTVTLGLLSALRSRGQSVQPFKAGPDFIDPSHHTRICGRASRNLDTWICDDETVAEIFFRASAGADIAIIEGVMGLFDGFGPDEARGSTAHLAKLLQAPVLLVIDAARMATSAAAIALGCQAFDSDLRFAGVLFNNVGGEGHYRWLKRSLEKATSLKALGFLPFDRELRIGERHLGLIPAPEGSAEAGWQDRLTAQFAQHVDVDGIIAAAKYAPLLEARQARVFVSRPKRAVKIGVAFDRALNFYYPENLELLAHCGAEIVRFSLLDDEELPPELRGVYLGGGFPELFARELASNETMKRSIRSFHACGGAIYAECGGLMILCEALVDLNGERHPMVDLIPAVTAMRRERFTLGYVEVEPIADTLIAPRGERYRAHTFHYSELQDARFSPATRLYHSGGESLDGYADRHLFASYAHAYFAARPQLAERLVARCAD